MTTKELEDKFTINPPKDIEPYFSLLNRIDINMDNIKHCMNCGDGGNIYNMPSVAWSIVRRCVRCKTLNVIYIADRMGGGFQDTVFIYGEKND